MICIQFELVTRFLLHPWNKAIEKALQTINLFWVIHNYGDHPITLIISSYITRNTLMPTFQFYHPFYNLRPQNGLLPHKQTDTTDVHQLLQ